MAAGDRKIKITEVRINSGNPVPFQADWQMTVEDRVGGDRYITGGSATGSFGSVATFNAKTGSQLRADALAAVTADANTPPRDSIS